MRRWWKVHSRAGSRVASVFTPRQSESQLSSGASEAVSFAEAEPRHLTVHDARQGPWCFLLTAPNRKHDFVSVVCSFPSVVLQRLRGMELIHHGIDGRQLGSPSALCRMLYLLNSPIRNAVRLLSGMKTACARSNTRNYNSTGYLGSHFLMMD